MKILKYNIKKPKLSSNFDHYFYYKGLTRKERRTKMVLTSVALIPVRKYYMSIENFRFRQYNESMEKYNSLCEKKRERLAERLNISICPRRK